MIAALDAIAAGKPKPADAYALTRVTTLVLHAYAQRLAGVRWVDKARAPTTTRNALVLVLDGDQ